MNHYNQTEEYDSEVALRDWGVEGWKGYSVFPLQQNRTGIKFGVINSLLTLIHPGFGHLLCYRVSDFWTSNHSQLVPYDQPGNGWLVGTVV